MPVFLPPLRLTAREIRGQLAVLFLVLWAVAVVNAWTPTRYLRSGHLKGTDFVHFYTLATLAARGEITEFDSHEVIGRLQADLVPESADLVYPPLYGPQIPLALQPLARLTYGAALATWMGITGTTYIVLLLLVARRSTVVGRHMMTALLAGAAFPPFWQLVLHGQLSVLALAAVVGAWAALRRGAPGFAGLCLGLLAYKPSLFVPVLALLALSRSWWILATALTGGAAQLLATWPWVGATGIIDYLRLLAALLVSPDQIAAKPEQMHSLRAFWSLLIPWQIPALVAYGLTAMAIIAVAARAWRRVSDPSLRFAVLSLATVLAAPHLYVYDLVILMPTWIWLVEWSVRRRHTASVGRLLYAGYLAPLAAPLVGLIHVQLSTLCLAGLLVAVMWHAKASPALADGTPPDRV